MSIIVRNEQSADLDPIECLTRAAFENEPYSSHTEEFIINSLRRFGQLTISLVAVEGEAIVGHVAVSPVTLSSGVTGWFGLGPISVLPEHQGQGIGSRLMNAALERLRHSGAAGCVILGSPGYYGRFGFKVYPGLRLSGAPPEYFQALSFTGELPIGDVCYHEAFEAKE